MRKFIVATVFACSVMAFPALVNAENAAEDTAAEEDPYAPDTVRCERVAVTGSRARRTRVCMTNAEWAAQRDGTRSDARDLVDRTTINSAASE